MAEKNSLWKNIRANRGSGKKPTLEMLRQERKIKAKKYAEGSFVGEDEPSILERPLSIPMEGYDWADQSNLVPVNEQGLPYMNIKEFEVSAPAIKKSNKATTKQQVKPDLRVGNSLYVPYNTSDYSEPKYVSERDASSTKVTPAMSTKPEKDITPGGLDLQDLTIITDAMQLGNFVPHPLGQFIGKIGSWGSASLNGLQAYDSYDQGNYGDMTANIISAGLGAYLGGKGRGYTRDMNNTVPGSLADKIAGLGSRSGTYRPLTATPNLRNNAVIKRALNYNRGLLGLTGAETIYDSKAEGGFYPTQGPPKALFKGYAEGGYVKQYATGSTVSEEGEDGVTPTQQEPVAFEVTGPTFEVVADKPDYLKAYDDEYEKRMNEQKAFQESWYPGQDYDKTPLENRSAMAANDAAAKIIIERKKLQGYTPDKYSNRQEFLKRFNDKEKSIIGNSNLSGYIGPDAGSRFRAALNNINYFGNGFKNTDPDLTQEEANNISRWDIFSPLGVPTNIARAAIMGDDIGGALHGRTSRPWLTSDEVPMGMENVAGINMVGDVGMDPLNLTGMGIGKGISNALKPTRKIAAPSYFAKPVENIANFTLKAKDARDNIVRGAIGSKQLFDQVIGELARGKINRKSIEEGNKYLENWIQNKATQDKIDADIPADVFDNQTMIDPSTSKQYLFNIPDLIKKQAKNFKPESKEYSLLQQFKDNIDQYLGVSKEKSIHHDNYGVSYKHNYDPIERQLIDLGLMTASNKYGSWVSRINKLSPFKRAGTTLHENVHDWVDYLTMHKSGMRDMVLNNLNPDYFKDFHEWEALHSQGINPASVMGDYRAFRGYMANPTEMHARTMELRKFFNITPDQFITEDFAKQMIDYLHHLRNTRKNTQQPITGLSYYLDALDNDPKKVSTIFNKFWGVVPAAVAGTAIPSIGKADTTQSQQQARGGYTMKNNNKSWREYLQYAQGGYTNPYNQYQKDPYLKYDGGGGYAWGTFNPNNPPEAPAVQNYAMDPGQTSGQPVSTQNPNTDRQIPNLNPNANDKDSSLQQSVYNANVMGLPVGAALKVSDSISQGLQTASQDRIAKKFGLDQGEKDIMFAASNKTKNIPLFGSTAGKFGDMWNLASGKTKTYLKDYNRDKRNQETAMHADLVNASVNAAHGGTISNNSLNLRNTMRNKRFAKGGTFDQFGINFIPESAGLHHESANGGVPIGPNALAEGGEAKLQMADGSQYIVSGEVNGANTQSINGETMTQRLKKKLKPFMMGGLASNPKDKENVRRPFDSYSEPAITQAANAAVQETEAVRMQRGGALQYAANGGKLNKDIEKIVMEEYAAAYGGKLPNKYKGKVNMPGSYAKGGIHIKESKKGTFTAAASRHGKSVQEFAKQVLANKENYSPAMVKKANFAHNAAGWKHADGGYVHNQMIQPMLAEGGPIYGDPASEYVYATGGMYGDPYARGGQIDYTNDMYSSYASGGPMVSNAPQAFKGPAAQNRGGMYLYPDGGMMPPEQQMMQEQQMQQQSGQDQMMQMVQQVMQALMQGTPPEQIIQQLVQSGVPPEQAQQVVQMAMQEAQGQMQQQQPMQGQEQQMMPQQGMMSSGGRMYYRGGPGGPPYDLPGMADMDSSEYNSINSYLTNLNTPNVIDNQGNTSSILGRMSNNSNSKLPTSKNPVNKQNPNLQQSIYTPTEGTQFINYDASGNPIYDSNAGSPFTTSGLTSNSSAFNFSPNTNYGIPGSNSYSTDQSASWEDETEYPTVATGVNPNGLGMNFKSDSQVTAPSSMMMQVQQEEPVVYAPDNMMAKVSYGNAANQNTDTPWFEEPLYSKVARPLQAVPGVVAAITAMKNKKRRLDPAMMAARTVNYEPERIIDREESRRALDSGLRTIRGSASNAGMLAGNTTSAVLNANKGLAGRIAESVMREENTNAQLGQQADMTNVANKNQFKQINEGMFQNAQTQAIAGLADSTSKLASTSMENRKQNLQEWIAQNRLGTRSYKTNINGQDVFVNADGQIYDAKTGTLLSAG